MFALHKEAAEQAKGFRNCEADPVAILYEVERISGSTRLSFEVWSSMKISKVQEVISGLNRFWARLCLLVAALLLVELGKATVPIPSSRREG